jgi:hypothetical protein
MKRGILGARGGTTGVKIFFMVLMFAAGVLGGDGTGRGRAETVELRLGQEKLLRSAGVRVRLVEIEEDSRCPQGVECIWAGNVRVALLVRGPGRTSRRAALNTASEPRELKLGGRTFIISKVSPAKIIDRDIKPRDYRITLKLSSQNP